MNRTSASRPRSTAARQGVGLHRWRVVGIAIAGTALVASLTACGASSEASSSAAYGAAASRAADLSAGGTTASASSAAPTKTSSGDTRADQSVTITGTLTLTAADPIHAANAIATIVTGSGGRIANSTEEPKHDASAALTARIPAARFDATLHEIERQGRVANVSMQTTDVTQQVTDTAVRIRTLQQSIARLQALLGRASTTTDLVAIESSLEKRQTDLEVMLSDEKVLGDQISYATLSVSIFEPSAVPRPKPTTFTGAVVAGFAALVSTAVTVVVGFGYALPWLVLLAVLLAIALLIRRSLLHRGRDTTQPQAE